MTLYKELVEIDSRTALNGESIPEPKVYEEGQVDALPLYVKSDIRPIKLRLPWVFNQIYRYV